MTNELHTGTALLQQNMRNLEQIAKITAHIRDLLENTDVRETWQQAHGLTMMIDGLLIAEGLEFEAPDYALERALNEPQYEVRRREQENDGEQLLIDELFDVYKIDFVDIETLEKAYGYDLSEILVAASAFKTDEAMNDWIRDAYAIVRGEGSTEDTPAPEETFCATDHVRVLKRYYNISGDDYKVIEEAYGYKTAEEILDVVGQFASKEQFNAWMGEAYNRYHREDCNCEDEPVAHTNEEYEQIQEALKNVD